MAYELRSDLRGVRFVTGSVRAREEGFFPLRSTFVREVP
jgi:hypothetical protein